MTGAWWQYALTFFGATSLSFLFTPLAIAVALRRGVFDKPGGHKSHESPVPYLGGTAVVVAFSLSMLIPVIAINDYGVSHEFVSVISIAVALAVLGLLDDLRGLSSILRLVCEIAVGASLWFLDVGVQLFEITWLNAVVTVLWVVGITNAFNLLDNMDGLSAGIAGIASVSFFAVAASNGQYLVAGLSLALGGCALGFLRHNFHPAKVYMGDSGALFFGFLISYVGLKLQLEVPSPVSILVPVVVCSVAILDTTLVTISRLRHGLSPFQGGRDHVSHRLVKIGLPVPVAVLVLYAAASSVGVIAFVLPRVDRTSAWTLSALVFVLLLVLGVLSYRVPVYPNSKQRHFVVVEAESA
jgi:UDP-GlcNAc:undecaprenyl-phosphate GlcNAc-1-phosphate transferase